MVRAPPVIRNLETGLLAQRRPSAPALCRTPADTSTAAARREPPARPSEGSSSPASRTSAARRAAGRQPGGNRSKRSTPATGCPRRASRRRARRRCRRGRGRDRGRRPRRVARRPRRQAWRPPPMRGGGGGGGEPIPMSESRVDAPGGVGLNIDAQASCDGSYPWRILAGGPAPITARSSACSAAQPAVRDRVGEQVVKQSAAPAGGRRRRCTRSSERGGNRRRPATRELLRWWRLRPL